jgi:hypothetical protein
MFGFQQSSFWSKARSPNYLPGIISALGRVSDNPGRVASWRRGFSQSADRLKAGLQRARRNRLNAGRNRRPLTRPSGTLSPLGRGGRRPGRSGSWSPGFSRSAERLEAGRNGAQHLQLNDRFARGPVTRPSGTSSPMGRGELRPHNQSGAMIEESTP